MHIELKKGVYLCSDPRQYWIQREWISHRKDKNGEVQEVVNTKVISGYCRDLVNLYNSYFGNDTRSSEAQTVAEIIKHIEKTRRDIHKWIKESGCNE